MTARRQSWPGRESQWLRIPEALRPWMVDPHSLTRRMQAACPGAFRLKLLTQAWGRPLPEEALELDLRQRQLALVRQVLLLCGDTPWVFARTIVPPRTLRGPLRRLAGLGTRPLGEILFAEPSTRRTEMRLFHLASDGPLRRLTAEALGFTPARGWARRSVFHLRHHPLLVSEVFLPELLDA